MDKKVSILVTGDEITKGYVLDTNSNYYAKMLTANAVNVEEIIKIRDNRSDIADSIKYLADRYDSVIISGGLGPTSDDLTRFSLADYLCADLIIDDESWQHITKRMTKFNLNINVSNKQQALFPQGADVIVNKFGTANGCYINKNGIDLFMIPGPPNEGIPMFDEYVLPRMLNLGYNRNIYTKQWRIIGISESSIAPQLDLIAAKYNIDTAFCAKYPYLDFMITASKYIKDAIDEFDKFLKDIFVCNGFYSASYLLMKLIEAKDFKFYIADHATGNLFFTKLVSPKTFPKLTTVNSSNVDFYIEIYGLDEYWNSKDSDSIEGTTKLFVTIKHKGTIHKFERDLIFKNANDANNTIVRESASEYVCFYLLQIINNL